MKTEPIYDFAMIVKKLRETQRRYFKFKTHPLFLDCKRLETQVDLEVSKIQNARQITLFDKNQKP